MNKFIKITTKKQLDDFLDAVWNFHDGVVSKMKYISGSSGSKEGTCPFDENPRILMRIEGCNFNDTSIDGVELLFEGVVKAFISPTRENYTSNILEANIALKNDKFIFVDDISDDLDKIDTDETCYYYVMSTKLSYRLI